MIKRNLKTMRKNARLTQEELAEKLHVTRQTVAKWEAGDSLPDIESCIAMSKLYSVTIDDIVRFSKDPDDKNAPAGKHIFGVVKIRPDHTIKLPDSALEVFDLEAGDKLLLLGDETQGMALTKLGGIHDFIGQFSEALRKSEEEDRED